MAVLDAWDCGDATFVSICARHGLQRQSAAFDDDDHQTLQLGRGSMPASTARALASAPEPFAKRQAR